MIDPNDPKGKQQAIHKAESFAEYLAKRGAGGDAGAGTPAAAPAAAAPAAAAPAAAAPAATGGSVAAALSSLVGPEIFWGADGVFIGKEESDIKGYDTFNQFQAGVAAAGVDLNAGEYTVFAVPDSVLDEFKVNGGVITPDLIKNHILARTVSTSAFSSSDLTTLQGGSLTYRRMFRKDFIDDATPGVKSEGASMSQTWPSDVACSNGILHSCNAVLTPGWTPVN